jgi:DNA-binding beta-propeller fold protein YncE
MKKQLNLLGIILLLSFNLLYSQKKPVEYQLIKKIPIAGNGSWDYLTVDNFNNRLFISHGNVVDVLDLQTEALAGQVLNTPGVHGITCVPEFNKGFVTAGKVDSVIVFDLKTLKVIKRIKTDLNPDFILYDSYSRRIFTFNGRGKSISAIDPKTDSIIGTIRLSGKPESAVINGKGTIFCNIEDKSTIVKVDTKALKIRGEWPLLPGKGPTGLAFDSKSNHLFSACNKSKQIMVLNASTGVVVDTIPIGEGCDGVVFIPEDNTVVSSNGEGTITVAHQKDANSYEVIQTVKTKKNARTIAYGRVNKKMYLPCADVLIENGKRRVLPGTFNILVVGK